MYPFELGINDMTVSNTSVSYIDLLLPVERDDQLHTSIYDKRNDVAIIHLRPPLAFYLTTYMIFSDLLLIRMFYSMGNATFQ